MADDEIQGRRPGTIAWDEHMRAWNDYAQRFGDSQDALKIHRRGGFSYGELTDHLGHEPETWIENPRT